MIFGLVAASLVAGPPNYLNLRGFSPIIWRRKYAGVIYAKGAQVLTPVADVTPRESNARVLNVLG